MLKLLIFILIICCTPISFLFGAASKLENPSQPDTNPVEITLVSEEVGPDDSEEIILSQPNLKYKGTIILNSPHPAFGGFSDLLVSKDRNTFLAVSDMGFWIKGSLEYSASGNLKGVGRVAQLGQLLNTKGKTFAVKYNSDSEALSRAPGSGYLVAYERVHRINHYKSGKDLDLSGAASQLTLPDKMKNSPENGGIESLLLLPDNTLFALTEGDDAYGKESQAAILKNGGWSDFKYLRSDGFRPTSAANLPDNRILILERRYSGPGTLGIRLATIDNSDIKEGASVSGSKFLEITPPLPRDNYEGLDTVTSPDGKTYLYIISDDNFSPLQHTILTLFELAPSALE